MARGWWRARYSSAALPESRCKLRLGVDDRVPSKSAAGDAASCAPGSAEYGTLAAVPGRESLGHCSGNGAERACRGGIGPAAMVDVLAARAGERVLEVGPGTGYYSLAVAASLAGGTLDVLDVPREFLDHVARRAEAAAITNIRLSRFLLVPKRTFAPPVEAAVQCGSALMAKAFAGAEFTVAGGVAGAGIFRPATSGL